MHTLKLLSGFVLLALLLTITQCEKKKPTINKLADEKPVEFENKWFTKDDNYKNYALYSAKIKKEYNSCLKDKKYENAKILLYSYGSFLSNKAVSDSVFVTIAEDFYNKKSLVKKDSTFALIYCYCADAYRKDNNFKKAIYWAEKALHIDKNLHSKEVNSRAKSILGNCYLYSNQPEKAVQLFAELIYIAEQERNYSALGSLYYLLANAYATLNAHNEANKFFKKSANSYLKEKDTLRYLGLQSAFAQTDLSNKKDTIATLKFLDSILITAKLYKNREEVADVTIAEIKTLKSLLTKNYDSALYYNNISFNYYKKSKGYLLDFQFIESDIYFQKNKKLKNKQETLTMLGELLVEERYLHCATLYNQLYLNAKSENNTKEALFYRDKEIELKDSILISNQKGQLFEFDKKYQSEKKEKIIAQQNNKLAKSYNYILLLLGIVFSIVVFFWIYSLRRKRKQAIVEQLKQEQFTFQLLQNTEEERNRIANELHDSVNHDLLNIRNKVANKKTIETTELEQVINEVRNISRNLYPAVLENLGLEASIEALCERVTNESSLFTTCEINYKQHLSKSKELQLYRIIQEALNNTLKHGNANAAKVILNASENQLHIEIKDNGKGFDFNEKLNSKTSFGLQSILQRAKAIAAKIDIRSNQFGTVILLKIPL